MARGEFVALLDSDDAWLPGKLPRQVEMLETDPGAGMLYAATEYMDGESRAMAPPRPKRRAPSGEILGELLRENFIRTPTVLFRRELFLRAGGYDPALNYGNDWDMWIWIATGHRVLYDPVPSARYRLHADQAVRFRRRMAEGRITVLERHLPRIESKAPRYARQARRALGSRYLKLAKLHLRAGRDEEAADLIGKSVRLVPSLRLEAFRLRISEGLKRRRQSR
jgi:glycosyltransferase involved in cell wall biosynthesis